MKQVIVILLSVGLAYLGSVQVTRFFGRHVYTTYRRGTTYKGRAAHRNRKGKER